MTAVKRTAPKPTPGKPTKPTSPDHKPMPMGVAKKCK